MRIPTEEDVLKMPVELPEDLLTGDGEMYTLSVDHEWLRRLGKDAPIRVGDPAKIDLGIVSLKFTTVARPKAVELGR
ncbi:MULTISPECIES: hypothetical protein [unclassified Bradyrhizobium]|uniref:hypothetical protein n=1 Tax=unclassified Bradyrhizobium TaxID=2631580 RepID=UPI0024E140C0|nr:MULTISPECIES: hypothetical protein [unclassified Bradyrhizobium]